MMRSTVLLACSLMFCAVLPAAPAFADEPAQQAAPWGVVDLMHSLAQVQRSRASFVERKYLAMLKEPLSFAGQLEYVAPSRLEKRTLVPKPESMMVDGDRLEVQNGDGKKRTLSLQEYPAIWAFVESIRSTLAGDLETLRRFYRVALEGEAGRWRLTLQPLDKKMKDMVSEILIDGRAEQINKIEIREPGGDYSVMSIGGDDS